VLVQLWTPKTLSIASIIEPTQKYKILYFPSFRYKILYLPQVIDFTHNFPINSKIESIQVQNIVLPRHCDKLEQQNKLRTTH